MPTLVDVGGGTYPKKYKDDEKYPLEGISIRPLFRGDCITRNESLFYEWNDGRAVQTENMKLVQWGDEWELYDRRTDITETRNLAADYPDTVAKLQAQWEAWADLSKH